MTENVIRKEIEEWLSLHNFPPLSYFEGGGELVTTPPYSELEIPSCKVYEITPIGRRMLQQRTVRNLIAEIKGIRPAVPCIGELRFRCQIVKKLIPPEFFTHLLPVQIDKMKVHLNPLDLKCEGDIMLSLTNGTQTKKGQKCEKRRYEEYWHCTPVGGSDVIFDNDSLSDLQEDITDAKEWIIYHAQNLFGRLLPGDVINTEAHWETEGFFDWLKAIYDYVFANGNVTCYGHIDYTINYEFPKGEKSSKTFRNEYSEAFKLPVKSIGLYW